MLCFRQAIAFSLVWLLLATSLAAQTRTQPPSTNPKPPDVKDSAGKPNADRKVVQPYSGAGPEIRIGLTTEASTVAISSAGEIDLQEGAQGGSLTLGPDTVRLRVNQPKTVMARGPRGAAYHVHVVALTERVAAERLAARLGKKYGEAITAEYNSATRTYNVRTGSLADEKAAAALRKQLQRDGYEEAEVVSEAKETKSPARIQVSNGNDPEILAATKPVIIAPGRRSQSPLTFNQTQYRGRLEVFINGRQLLTVVNAVPLEDYLRGVVPAELSPASFPQLEALKAQAVAARTYALRNRGQFKEEGFDLLPTPVSQVYGGLSQENELTNRAVDETRGIVVYHDGEPINALYSSTCGGRTESVENIFNGPALPYLRGVSCAIEQSDLRKYTITTRRLVEEVNNPSGLRVREAITLKLAGFDPGRSLTRDYLDRSATREDLRNWLSQAATIAAAAVSDETGGTVRPRRAAVEIKEDLTQIGWLAQWLVRLFYGDSHPGLLLSQADAGYIIGAADSGQIAPEHRTAVATLMQTGVLQPAPDGLLHAEKPITRERALIALARLLERSTSAAFEHGVARASGGRTLALRGEQKTTVTIPVSDYVYLFRQVGDELYPAPSVHLIGGEKVRYHVNQTNEVDFLAVIPNPSGASSDRYSPFSRWTEEVTRAELQSRLRKARLEVGELIDIVPVRTGGSQRVVELRVIGRRQTVTVSGGSRVRTSLGLRDSLFVVEREHDRGRQVRLFRFTGRGWGHGVGLCQVGAYGLALEGHTYDLILRHYYTGVSLRKAY